MKLTVIGYTEPFALNPSVSIYKGGVLIGKVGRGGKVILDIEEPCELEFKCSLRSTKCHVSEHVGCVVLSFNRATGKLTSTPTKSEQETLCEISKAKSADGNRIIWIIIICALLLSLSLFFNLLAN